MRKVLGIVFAAALVLGIMIVSSAQAVDIVPYYEHTRQITASFDLGVESSFYAAEQLNLFLNGIIEMDEYLQIYEYRSTH